MCNHTSSEEIKPGVFRCPDCGETWEAPDEATTDGRQ